MYYNRDEFMLLSRTGRVPPRSRGGPPRPFHEPVTVTSPAGAPWLRKLLSAAVRGRAKPQPAGARRAGAGARRAGDTALADRDAYLELEFAVGFAADEEPWL